MPPYGFASAPLPPALGAVRPSPRRGHGTAAWRALALALSLPLMAAAAHGQASSAAHGASPGAPDPHGAFGAPLLAAPLEGPAASYRCDPSRCTGPDCRCATTAAPGALPVPQVPQFVLVTWDDCVNTASEATVRPLLDGLRNPDGRPVPSTYFVSLEGCPIGQATDPALVQARYAAGDEIGVHTRTHRTGSHTTRAEWTAELGFVREALRSYGLGADAGLGFRAPYVATNEALYGVLDSLGFLYDSSIFEQGHYAPVSRGPRQLLWPFTYDQWPTGTDAAARAARAQSCDQFAPGNRCPDQPHTGLWQVPIYQYTSTDVSPQAQYYGGFDVGGPSAFSGYPQRIRGAELRRVLDQHLAWRLGGNRAPLNLYFHAPAFDEADRTATYREFLASSLARGDVWAVTMPGLIEWMRAPVPASEMTAWYAAYCQRHACAPGTSTGADAVATLGAAQISPSVTHSGLATLHGTAGATRVVVYDVAGRAVARYDGPFGDGGVVIDVAAQAAGVYLVRIEDDRGSARTLRLVRV